MCESGHLKTVDPMGLCANVFESSVEGVVAPPLVHL
jgi:hypothetical protein